MVGGRVIEVMEMGLGVYRLWCIDGADECAVYCRAQPEELPKCGDEIWWQSGKIYLDGDTRSLEKIGNSHDPRPAH